MSDLTDTTLSPLLDRASPMYDHGLNIESLAGHGQSFVRSLMQRLVFCLTTGTILCDGMLII